MEWLAGFAKNLGDDIRDSSLVVTPAVEGVDAAADQDEALVFDKLIVNRLGRDVFSLEIAVFDVLGDIAKVHRFAIVGEDNINLVTDVLWVDGRAI